MTDGKSLSSCASTHCQLHACLQAWNIPPEETPSEASASAVRRWGGGGVRQAARPAHALVTRPVHGRPLAGRVYLSCHCWLAAAHSHSHSHSHGSARSCSCSCSLLHTRARTEASVSTARRPAMRCRRRCAVCQRTRCLARRRIGAAGMAALLPCLRAAAAAVAVARGHAPPRRGREHGRHGAGGRGGLRALRPGPRPRLDGGVGGDVGRLRMRAVWGRRPHCHGHAAHALLPGPPGHGARVHKGSPSLHAIMPACCRARVPFRFDMDQHWKG